MSVVILSSKNRARSSKFTKGFTLLELAFALIIVGLLFFGIQGVSKLLFDTDHRLEQIEKNRVLQGAFETYLAVNSRLPCPDVDGDGNEDFNSSFASVCSSDVGFLPYDDFGVEELDAWGNRYHYKVVSSTTSTSPINTLNTCHASSAFAKEGTMDTSSLHYCPTSHQYACDMVDDCLDDPLTTSVIEDWESVSTAVSQPPYFSIYAPMPDDGILIQSTDGQVEQADVLAVIISAGANGHDGCSAADLSAAEIENCDFSNALFIHDEVGVNRDYILAITFPQAKRAIISSRRFR